MEMIAVVVALAILIAAFLWYRSRSLGSDGESARPQENLDTLAAWEPTPTRILTVQERLAYAVLARALPEHIIFAQVPLSRFLKVPTRNSYTEWLSRVGQLCADLVVCDSSTTVLAVIDVRTPPHAASDRNRRRHERMHRVLKAAGIPLHVWIEHALPTPEGAREAILPKPVLQEQASAGAAPAAATVPVQKQRALPTVTDETEGITPDEIIEMTEPPPSTWFDNLESRPAPLRQARPTAPPAAGGGAKPPIKR